jgi:hypothetical protein
VGADHDVEVRRLRASLIDDLADAHRIGKRDDEHTGLREIGPLQNGRERGVPLDDRNPLLA